MSTVDDFVRCPQCQAVANRTFDTHDSSTLIGCDQCGWTEYRGPRVTKRGHVVRGSWIEKRESGAGVLAFTTSESRGIVTVWRLSDEEEFREAERATKEKKIPFSWYRLTRWNAATRKVDVASEFTADGHQAPDHFLSPSNEEEVEAPISVSQERNRD